MSDLDTLCVRTLAGLTLRLSHHHSRTLPDDVSATLFLPLTRTERAGYRQFGKPAAFVSGGTRLTQVYIDPSNVRYPSVPPSLWLGGANFDLDANAAATVQAWLDSRTPYVAPDPQPAPARELPADIATPAAVERAA